MGGILGCNGFTEKRNNWPFLPLTSSNFTQNPPLFLTFNINCNFIACKYYKFTFLSFLFIKNNTKMLTFISKPLNIWKTCVVEQPQQCGCLTCTFQVRWPKRKMARKRGRSSCWVWIPLRLNLRCDHFRADNENSSQKLFAQRDFEEDNSTLKEWNYKTFSEMRIESVYITVFIYHDSETLVSYNLGSRDRNWGGKREKRRNQPIDGETAGDR